MRCPRVLAWIAPSWLPWGRHLCTDASPGFVAPVSQLGSHAAATRGRPPLLPLRSAAFVPLLPCGPLSPPPCEHAGHSGGVCGSSSPAWSGGLEAEVMGWGRAAGFPHALWTRLENGSGDELKLCHSVILGKI